MFSEYYILLLLYPISFALYKLLEKTRLSKRVVLYTFSILLFASFYGLFSSFIISRVENSYLILTALVYFFAFLRDRQTLSNLYKYYTSFWLSLITVWGFIGYMDAVFLLGLSLFLFIDQQKSYSIERIFMWLFLIIISLVIGDIGVVEGLVLRSWFIEIAFFILFVICIPVFNSIKSSTLSQYILTLGVMHLALEKYGLLPYYFSRVIILLQILFIINFANKKRGRDFITGALCSAVLLIPSQGVESTFQITMVVYILFFLVFASMKLERNTLYSLFHYLISLFIAYQMYSFENLTMLQGLSCAVTFIGIIINILDSEKFAIRERQATIISS